MLTRSYDSDETWSLCAFVILILLLLGTQKMEIHLKKILKYALGGILIVNETNAKYHVKHLV